MAGPGSGPRSCGLHSPHFLLHRLLPHSHAYCSLLWTKAPYCSRYSENDSSFIIVIIRKLSYNFYYMHMNNYQPYLSTSELVIWYCSRQLFLRCIARGIPTSESLKMLVETTDSWVQICWIRIPGDGTCILTASHMRVNHTEVWQSLF